jgi:hypothetical protein
MNPLIVADLMRKFASLKRQIIFNDGAAARAPRHAEPIWHPRRWLGCCCQSAVS